MLQEYLLHEDFFCIFRQKRGKKMALVLAEKKEPCLIIWKDSARHCYSLLIHLTQHTFLKEMMTILWKGEKLRFPIEVEVK